MGHSPLVDRVRPESTLSRMVILFTKTQRNSNAQPEWRLSVDCEVMQLLFAGIMNARCFDKPGELSDLILLFDRYMSDRV